MGFVPIFLQLQDKACLVVGGGKVALRKVQPLLDAGALVTVISPEVGLELASLAESGRISLLRRRYRSGDMKGHHLVYAATDDRGMQRRLYEEACRRKILINVADAPEFCSFIVPSVVRRGRLQVAVSTEGSSPAVARMLRHRMQDWLGDEIEALLEVMTAARDWLKSCEPDAGVRRRKLNALAASGLDDALRRRDAAAVQRIVSQCLGDSVSLADLKMEAASIRTNP